MQQISFVSPSVNESYLAPKRVNPSDNQLPLRVALDNVDTRERQMMKAYQDAVAIANLTDKQLLSIAKQDANKDNKHKAKTYATAMLAVPAIDIASKGVFTDAPKLSGKLGSMGKASVGWAGVFALAGLYNGAVEKVTAVSPTLKKFEEKHPAISSLLNLAGFATAIVGAEIGLKKLGGTLAKKFPGAVADLKNVKATVAEAINSSKINQKVLKPIKDNIVTLAKKYPKVASLSKTALALAAPALAAGVIFKAITDRAEKRDQMDETLSKLAMVRELNRQAVKKINAQVIDEPLALAANKVANTEMVGAEMDLSAAGKTGTVSKTYGLDVTV